MFSRYDYIMTPKSLSWIVITNLKIFTLYVEMDCFSNQHYFAFVKSESHPFIISQSAGQNVPSVLHSDSFLNILHKFSIISKPCHITLHFLFKSSTNPYGYLPVTSSHLKNSPLDPSSYQWKDVLFYQIRVVYIFLCPNILATLWSWFIPWHLACLLLSNYPTTTTTLVFWNLQ